MDSQQQRLQSRLEELTREALCVNRRDVDAAKSLMSELALIRSVVQTWRLFEGYDGGLGDEPTEDKVKQVSTDEWD